MRVPLVARAARAVVVVGALAASGCNLGGGTEGELGHGRFHYRCVQPVDLFCSDAQPGRSSLSSVAPPVPEAVVLGSTFALEFDLDTPEDGDTSLSIDVECAIDAFEDAEGHVRPTREGWLAFVAERSDGAVADIIHVLVATPARLELFEGNTSLGNAIVLARSTTVATVPYGSGGQVLHGGISPSWTSSDPSVVTIGAATGGQSGPVVTLVPGAAGEATLTVTLAGTTRDLVVEVPAEEAP